MRLYGLIGAPLSHSFSAQYFEKKFADEKITDADYGLFPLENISQLPQLIEQLPDLHGLNVTIPFKISVLQHLNHISKVASAVGAVNCIKITRDQSGIELSGYNSDVYGFRKSLLPLLKSHHYSALILGTGGAAKAVSYALQELGISYTLVSRSANNKNLLRYSEITEEILKENQLIINATPAGMYPETDNFPDIPYQFITERHLLYDLIYNPAETRFLRNGRERGAATKNGLQMLELQAEKSWEIWNG